MSLSSHPNILGGGSPALGVPYAWTAPQSWTRVGTINSGISYLLQASYTAAPAAADQPFGMLSSLTFNGSATPSAGEHGSAFLGRFFDTSLNRHGGIGMEGKVDATGLATQYIGVSGDVGFVGSAFAGTMYGFAVTRGSITTDGVTPLAQGANVGLYVPNLVGGALKLGVFSKEQVRVDNTIVAYSTSGTGGTTMSHDGTSGYYATVAGNLFFTAQGGAALVLVSAANLAPLVNNTNLGANGNAWNGYFSSTTVHALAASVTPANNGDLMFQATSNTSLTFKYKGSDGTVRSASVTLA